MGSVTGQFMTHGARVTAGAMIAAGIAACGGVAGGSPQPAGASTSNSAGSLTARTATATPSAAPHASAKRRGAPARATTVPGAPNCPMFPANNVWNTNISELPVDTHGAAWMKSMGASPSSTLDLHPDFGPDPGGYPYGIPFAVVTSVRRLVHIRFQYASESDAGPYPFGPATPIEGGENAGGDRHAIMVSADTCTLYELYDARYSARGSSAGSGAIWNLRSNALRPAGWTSADAAGLPILPGLLNFAQVHAAVRTGKPITHAIRFTAEVTRSSYLWPARHDAGSGLSPNLPPMGARFRLKANFRVPRFCRNSQPYCRYAKVVLREMKDYGLILADNGSNWYFQGSAFPQWPDALVSLLKGIPARDFEAVDESCLMVRPSSGLARAKPGCAVG